MYNSRLLAIAEFIRTYKLLYFEEINNLFLQQDAQSVGRMIRPIRRGAAYLWGSSLPPN